ncbi:MAG: acyltransferase [Planctomycetaceae bacterium]|jgi:glucans biosynthesis protein C|nr:acyltransferase [Planctomycetaceae bacterium]MDC0308193.1 acyltransferase [Planctomycetaceae bacterium]MDG2389836.1 acyltransferase [Planctomycetaceae bacterium]
MSHIDRQPEIPEGRLTGVDILRIVATLLVVALHAGIPYLPEMMPGLAWSVQGIDAAEQSRFVTWFVWSIECFIMPLFFIVSGVSTRIMLDRRGEAALFRNRRDRLLKPFLCFGVPILIAEFYIWNLGYVHRSELTWDQYWEFDAKDYDTRLWGIGHFWYLQYLLLYTILLVLSCKFRGSSHPGTERWFSWGGSRQYLSLIFVTLAWAIPFLTIFPNIVADFDHSVMPITKRIFYFGIYFSAGVSLVSSVRKSPRLAMRTALLTVITAAAMLPLAIPQIRAILGGPPALSEAYTGVILALVALGFSVGVTTLALRWNPPLSSTLKYLSASSYWVYFIHHLLCGAIHLGLNETTYTVFAKYMITLVGATMGSLVTYQLLIRNRWPEMIINGRKSTLGTGSAVVEENRSKSDSSEENVS